MNTAVSLAPYAPPADYVAPAVGTYSAPLQYEYDVPASRALGHDHWRVLSALSMCLIYKGKKVLIYVPAGYLTDGATVPQVFWDIIPPWGAYGEAAVVHDMLCEYLTVFDVDNHFAPISITRKDADNILRAALAICVMPAWKRWSIYAGVKVYTFTAELIHGRTKPQANATKRLLEDSWKPQLDITAEIKDLT